MPSHSLPIELYHQEEDAGCLAACAQMVLINLGTNISQAELNILFDLTPLGVPLSRLTRLNQHGVKVTIHRNGTLEDLIQALDQDTPCIVFIRTGQLSYWQKDIQHAVVLRGYDASHLLLNDPAFTNAAQKVLVDEFMLAWNEFDNAYAQITP